MNTKHDLKNRRVSLKTVCVTAFLVGLLVFAGTYYSLSARAYVKPLWLDLEIQPQNMKLGVNQSGTWWVLIHNGTKPYTVEWVFDGKVIGSETSMSFTPFLKPSNMTTLMVHVTDAQGNSGFASTTIYDPATINVYLDDLPAAATYTIKTDGSGNYWSVRYDGYVTQSTNATYVFNTAINLLPNGGSISIAKGNYQLNGSITISDKSNILLDFQKGSKLTCAAYQDTPAINLFPRANNCTIRGVTIDGNGQNQVAPSTLPYYLNNDGVCIRASNNSKVEDANIYNVRRFGFVILGSYGYGISVNDGILNSKISNIGWDAVQLNGERSGFSINNEISYASDCGISAWGFAQRITNNYIHDMGFWKITGYHNSSYGISIQGGSQHLIQGNVIERCYGSGGATGIGITLSASSRNLVSGNTVRYTHGVGIQIGDYDEASDNYVEDWNIDGVINYGNTAGILIDYQSAYAVVKDNIINSTEPHANAIVGINIYWSNNATVEGNMILLNGASGITGIYLEGGCYASIKNNKLYSGTQAFSIDGNSYYNHIEFNTLASFPTYFSGSGVGTIVRWNDGYRTEKSSSATNTTATTFVFDHQLVTTPLIVFANFNTTQITGWTWTATTTQITITIIGTSLPAVMKVYWEARTWDYP